MLGRLLGVGAIAVGVFGLLAAISDPPEELGPAMIIASAIVAAGGVIAVAITEPHENGPDG